MAADPQRTFTVDNVGQPEQVVAQTVCRVIIIREDGAASQDYKVRLVSASSNPVLRSAGDQYRFLAENTVFAIGQVVGWVETVAGSITMSQRESMDVHLVQ